MDPVHDNQWNGKFFDVQAPSGETFAAPISYLDVQIGLNYFFSNG
jgi:hypothetical protein